MNNNIIENPFLKVTDIVEIKQYISRFRELGVLGAAEKVTVFL
jgi:hypothetical protein